MFIFKSGPRPDHLMWRGKHKQLNNAGLMLGHCRRRRANYMPALVERGMFVMSQQTQYIDPMLGYCWPAVYDVGPTLIQHWVNASCLLVSEWAGPGRQTVFVGGSGGQVDTGSPCPLPGSPSLPGPGVPRGPGRQAGGPVKVDRKQEFQKRFELWEGWGSAVGGVGVSVHDV